MGPSIRVSTKPGQLHYYLTLDPDPRKRPHVFRDFAEVQSAFDRDALTFHDPVRLPGPSGSKVIETTVGRVLL